MNARRILRPLFAFAAFALSAGSPARAATWNVDLSAPAAGVLSAEAVEVEPGSELARRLSDGLLRRVELDRSSVKGLGGRFAPGDTLAFTFFDGEVRTFRVEEQFPSAVSRRVFSLSEPAAGSWRCGSLTVGEDGFSLRFDDAATGHAFRVFDGPDGSVVVEESDPSAGVVDECAPLVPDLPDDPAGEDGADAGGPDAKAIVQGSTVIDYMVVFDASGAAYAATQGGVQAVAEEVVSKMNTALVNSDLYSSYRFRLVDVMTVSENYTNLNTSSAGINGSNLSSTRTHGEILARRNSNGADMWTTLMDTGSAYGTTGLGWSLTSLSSARTFGSYACNICSIRAVLNSHTLTHETGHNMGAGHSNAPGASDPGPQMSDMAYSSGYHFKSASGTWYHTIMAYNSLTGQYYQASACFSSPLLTAGGSPCGTADKNDNRRVLLQTHPYAAAWKDSGLPVTYDVFPSEPDGKLFDGTLSVTIECGNPSEPVYYTLDGSDPTASSTRYTGAISITKTTTLKAACFSGGTMGPVATATYYYLPEELGVTGVSWTMSGDQDWVWDTAEGAARSGPITHSQTTTLTATLDGPGTFTFYWKADSESASYDYLQYVRSWEPLSIPKIGGSGLGWAQVSLEVPSGSQTIAWTYRKDGSVSSGADCGWVNRIVWTPDSSAPAGTVAAGTPSFTSCPVTVNVTKLGDGATSASIVLEYSTDSSFSPKQTLAAGSSGVGAKQATLTSLSPGTTYYVRAVLTGSPGGASATTDAVSFATPAYTAPALGTVSAAATTATVTLSVPVTSRGAGATSVTVSATLGGETKTATVSADGASATLSFDGLDPDTSYPWTVVATGVPTGKTANASGTAATEALPATGWFDVQWTSQGWGSGAAWRTTAGETAAGGRWTVPAGDASSLVGGLLALAPPDGGELRFLAKTPSASGVTVKISGTIVPARGATPPDAAGALAGLSFTTAGYKGWNGAQWVSLSGAAPSSASTEWTATLDFSTTPPRVRYAVGGTTLAASGSEWIALSTSQTYATGVGFLGGGSLGDFRAAYTGGGHVAPVLASLADDGVSPMEFGPSGTTLALRIANAESGAWYTVYASGTVDGTYRAVKSVRAAAPGLFAIEGIDATAPTKFIRLGVGDAQVAAGTLLPNP